MPQDTNIWVVAWPSDIKLTFCCCLFFFFQFLFSLSERSSTNMLGRKIHKALTSKGGTSIHYLLCTRIFGSTITFQPTIPARQHWCTHLILMSLSRGSHGPVNQDSNCVLRNPNLSLSTPWKTLEKGGRPPEKRDQHSI